jgi:hypothetical protein
MKDSLIVSPHVNAVNAVNAEGVCIEEVFADVFS